MKKAVTVFLAVAVMASASYSFGASIRNSKHDLSSTSSGGVTSNTTQLCVFCHTPHNSRGGYPLWNRNQGTTALTAFVMYTSANMHNKGSRSAGFTSDSVSLYCMTCHDGGPIGGRIMNIPADVVSGPVGVVNDNSVHPTPVVAGDQLVAGSRANLGTDLSNDHPVNFSITYTGVEFNNVNLAGYKMGSTQTLPLFRTAARGTTMECASCHNVHDPAHTPFLRMDNTGSALCLDCHNK